MIRTQTILLLSSWNICGSGWESSPTHTHIHTHAVLPIHFLPVVHWAVNNQWALVVLFLIGESLQTHFRRNNSNLDKDRLSLIICPWMCPFVAVLYALSSALSWWFAVKMAAQTQPTLYRTWLSSHLSSSYPPSLKSKTHTRSVSAPGSNLTNEWLLNQVEPVQP